MVVQIDGKVTCWKCKNQAIEGDHEQAAQPEGVELTERDNHADGLSDPQSEHGDKPLGDKVAPSPALNDSLGPSLTVIGDELQLDQVQRLATSGRSAISMKNQSFQPCLIQVMSVEIFQNPKDKEIMGGEILCLET